MDGVGCAKVKRVFGMSASFPSNGRGYCNIENKQHVTALNLACENEHEECALLLLHYGAAADVQDDWGDTPRSTAQAKGMHRVLAMML